MVVGHYASAYLALPYNRTAPWWLLLLCANLAEFLWLLLALAGVEPASPPSLLDATFNNLEVHMTYSHNVVPNLALGVLVYAAVLGFYRSQKLALWCFFLTCLHVWCDFIVGFQHQWLGPESTPIGLNSYARFPHLAILIELLFAWGCLGFYMWMRLRQGEPVARRQLVFLITVFTVGIAAGLPAATMPMRELLGL